MQRAAKLQHHLFEVWQTLQLHQSHWTPQLPSWMHPWTCLGMCLDPSREDQLSSYIGSENENMNSCCWKQWSNLDRSSSMISLARTSKIRAFCKQFFRWRSACCSLICNLLNMQADLESSLNLHLISLTVCNHLSEARGKGPRDPKHHVGRLEIQDFFTRWFAPNHHVGARSQFETQSIPLAPKVSNWYGLASQSIKILISIPKVLFCDHLGATEIAPQDDGLPQTIT